jgi:adenine-specific DNA-methyltransferase
VIDPYVGSGSTAVAALIEGRQFVGSDHNIKYVNIARARLKELKTGKLRIRPLGLPIQMPSTNQSVARPPAEWLQGSEYEAEHG